MADRRAALHTSKARWPPGTPPFRQQEGRLAFRHNAGRRHEGRRRVARPSGAVVPGQIDGQRAIENEEELVCVIVPAPTEVDAQTTDKTSSSTSATGRGGSATDNSAGVEARSTTPLLIASSRDTGVDAIIER